MLIFPLNLETSLVYLLNEYTLEESTIKLLSSLHSKFAGKVSGLENNAVRWLVFRTSEQI